MPNNLEFYENESVVSEEMQREIDEEIAHTPHLSEEYAERLEHSHNGASPLDSGGDVDADWEDSNVSGEESVGGENPTPDQSDTEMNAEAMGVTYQDNEPLDILG